MTQLCRHALWLGIPAVAASERGFAQAATDSAPSARALVGLWSSETLLTPMVSGTLTVDARGSSWTANIRGHAGRVRRNGDSVIVTLISSAGEFRGRWENARQLLRGHWIQPGTLAPYEQRYASPVVLTRAAANVWRGIVRPLEPRITFHVSIQPAGDGTIDAFMRNPEANHFADRRYKVQLTGDSITLTHPNVPEGGTYDKERDLSMWRSYCDSSSVS